MANYNYNKFVASDRMQLEISQSAIDSATIDYITTTPSTSTIYFTGTLDSGDEDILDALVDAHVATHLPNDPEAVYLEPVRVYATSSTSTSSSTFSTISSMTYTIPTSGTWLINYSGSFELGPNNSGEFQLYKNSDTVSGTLRNVYIDNTALLASSTMRAACAISTTVGLSENDVITVKFREVGSGTLTVLQREMILTRVN